ncbi:glutamine amidotransferase [Azoarcus olearius]|uniref:Glutamine amidotransferase domain-containing protein n=1 Tax=Azoarcus sp. (strain BH72) TaxID=418699 RepID=A1K8J3_AZOSB|nr:glutamine amidotransferase [Azoarcus olearius]CAL95148.1 conserved hypothetical protein [Azoarcus olearius]
MKKCIALRHVAFEDLGVFEPVLHQAGYQIDYRQAGIDRIGAAEAAEADLLVILGGPIGVYETEAYPFVADEIELARARLASGKPLLGICLGAQLIAAAAGARVYPGPAKEIGWSALTLSAAGRDSVLAPLGAPGVAVLHWHGDTFDLPEGATLLASTPLTPHQAFQLGEAVLALQFHPEADPAGIERWLIGHACELAHARVSLAALRADTERYGAACATAAATLLRDWLVRAAG